MIYDIYKAESDNNKKNDKSCIIHEPFKFYILKFQLNFNFSTCFLKKSLYVELIVQNSNFEKTYVFHEIASNLQK